MANTRYSCTVKSTKQFNRPANTIYSGSDANAEAVRALIEAQLENNAKLDLKKVIKEPGNWQMPASPVDTKASYMNFICSSNPDKKYRLYVPGLKDNANVDTLGKAIATLGETGVGIKTKDGYNLDVYVGDGKKQNIVADSTAPFYDPTPSDPE